MQHEKDSNNKEPIKVIGAMYPRTGTLSFKTALDRLGFKTFHMFDVISSPYFTSLMHMALEGNDEPLFEAIAEAGYNATTDFPMSIIWKQQFSRFPNAKVVLTFRDPYEWFESFDCLNDSYKALCGWPITWVTDAIKRPLEDILTHKSVGKIFGSKEPCYTFEKVAELPMVTRWWAPWVSYPVSLPLSREDCVDAYRKFLAEVRATVPKEQLFEWTPDGSFPLLAKFLGVDPPDFDFPHLHKREELYILGNIFIFFAWTWPFWCGLMVYITFVLLRFLLGRVFPIISYFIKGKTKRKIA